MRSKVFFLITILLQALFVFQSCEKIDYETGNGEIAEHTIETGDFKSVDVKGPFDVEIVQDSGMFVEIETDENLINLVEVRQHGALLLIGVKDNQQIDPSQLNITIHTGEILKLQIEIDGDLHTKGSLVGHSINIENASQGNVSIGVRCERLKFENNGSGVIQMKGLVKNADIANNSTSNIIAKGLFVKNMNLQNNAGANVEVNAFQNLSIENKRNGTVKYTGNPIYIEEKSTSNGEIIKF